ncbi:MAG: glycosyltransferase family 4 protein [Candidatus Obscuribacterales bacterium]|nr:glycosyltransferase family 4 protein [Candidatus Obscuribacterales bacterium]
MRICLISREYPPDTGWGGVGAFNYHIAHALTRAGHDVEVISLSAGEAARSSREEGVLVHRVAWKHLLEELNLTLVAAPASHYVIKTTVALWMRFMELHKEKPFEVVEVPEHLAGGLFHAMTRELPLVIHLHTPHSKFISDCFHGVTPSFDNRLICILERIGILLADQVISPSANLAGFVAEDTGYPFERIQVIKYPVDTEKFKPEGPRALADDGNLTVFFAGRLEERKGIHYLVEAMPAVVKAVPNVRFICVGADTNAAPGGGSMLAWLKKRLAENNCLDKVTFIPHIPLMEMPNYVRSADLCVVPSLYDNAPFTCIEGLASGKPVVATTAGGMGEYALHNERGLIVPPRSAEALADAIITLLKDEKMRLQFGKNAREFVASNLNLARKAEEKIALYEQAKAHFQSRNTDPLYMRGTQRSLRDALEVLCAYEQMMFETLSKQSLAFRMRHWFRFLKKRPRLAAAHLLVAGYRKAAGKHATAPAFIARLEEALEAQQKEQFSVTMSLASMLEDAAGKKTRAQDKQPVAAQ